jgi:hypothetical protein
VNAPEITRDFERGNAAHAISTRLVVLGKVPVTGQKRVGGGKNALDLLPLEAGRIEGAGDHSNEMFTNSEFGRILLQRTRGVCFQPEG